MKDASLAQGNQVLNLILQKRVPSEQVTELLESGLLARLLDAKVADIDPNKFDRVIGLTKLFPLEIWQGLPFSSWVERGKYKEVDPAINDLLIGIPIGACGTFNARVVAPPGYLKVRQARREIAKRRLLPATAMELLAFGAQHPKGRANTRTIALGSPVMIKRERFYLALTHWQERGLALYPEESFGNSFNNGFLAVPRPQDGGPKYFRN